MNPELEKLITLAAGDGIITDKEREIILRKAEALGVDPDEVEIYLENILSQTIVTEKEVAPSTKSRTLQCPNCGARISYESKCPECGYIFSSMEANASIEALFETLNQLNSEDLIKKRQVLESFPIPNSKSDILEFIVAFKAKLTSLDDKFVSAYLAKYTECIEKAKVYFPDDPDFLPFIHSLPEIKKELKKASLKRWIKNHKLLTFRIIYFASGMLITIISMGAFVFESIFPDKLSEQVRTMISSGDYDGARQFANGIKSDYSREELLDAITIAEVESLIANSSYDEAKTKAFSINSEYKREQTLDSIIEKEVLTLEMNNQLEDALQAASLINNEYTRGSTCDDIKEKLIYKYIEDGDLLKAEQMAKTMYSEYTRNKYIDIINNLQ